MFKKFTVLVLTVMMILTAFPISVLEVSAKTETSTSEGTQYSVGQIVEYGSYPQTLVEDGGLIEALNSVPAQWESRDRNGFITNENQTVTMFLTTDVEYGGEMYRGVKLVQYVLYGGIFTYYQKNYGYQTDVNYWFKYEPLKWRILDAENGLALCEDIIDVKPCPSAGQDENQYVNYATTNIREWLIGEFAETAFTSAELDGLADVKLTNTSYVQLNYYYNDDYTSTSENTYITDEVCDKVFLLSASELRNADYGFGIGCEDSDSIAFANSTDYTKALGIENGYIAFCTGYYDIDNVFTWMLRSTGKVAKYDTYYQDGSSWSNSREFAYTDLVLNDHSTPKIVTSGTTYYQVGNEGVRPAIRLVKTAKHEHKATSWEKLTYATELQNGRDVRRCKFCNEIMSERPNYLLKLDASGGSFSTTDTTKYTISEGERYSSVITRVPEPTRKYSVFTGFYDGSDAVDFENDVFNCTAAKTLSAGWEYTQQSGSCGDNLTWEMDFDNDKLIISGTGDMYTYSYPDIAPWSMYSPYIKRIIVSEGVDSLGSYAFSGFYALKQLIVADSETVFNQNILDYRSDSITIISPESSYARTFASVLYISWRNITESGYCGANKEYAWHFDFSTGLLSIVGVENYSGEITNPDAKYENDYEQWSEFVDNITSAYIGNGVKSIGDWFRKSSALKKVEIGEGVESIGIFSFYKASALEEISIPSTLKGIGDYAFAQCTSLKKVNLADLGAWCGVDLENIDSGFFDDHIYVSTNPNPFYYGAELYLNGVPVNDLVIPEGLTKISGNVFKGCSNIESVTVPASVKQICASAFMNCSSLSSVDFDEGVEKIENCAFGFCPKLYEINIPDSVTELDSNAFIQTGWYNSQEDGLLYLDGFLLGLKNVYSIENINIAEGTKYISPYAFIANGSIRSVTIPGSLKEIKDSFSYCFNLTDVTIADGVEKIGENAFSGCNNLHNLTIPASVTEIAETAFPSLFGFTVNCYRNTAAEAYAKSRNWTCNYLDKTTVTADGLKVTVDNLYGVKEFWIAKGTHTTYRQIKNTNGYINVTSSKLGGKSSYTHGVAIGEPGDYTCLIRYNDPNKADEFIYFTCEVTYPSIEVDGRQITFGNLDGVKTVRIAQGSYSTLNEIKKAPGALGYSAATIAKLADEDGNFILNKNCTEEGTTYTVAITYNNFYQEIHTITLKKKVPTYVVSGNSITFTNIEGCSLIRYAKGRYSTASGIKNAAGSRYFRPNEGQESVTFSGLSGRYSFLVQYYENSQNFYVIDF